MLISLPELNALIQVIIVDLVLAGDNAVVVGLAAAGLAKEQRAKVIIVGIAAAAVLRIIFALATAYLLQIIGLLLAGGLLLLWVCWKFWRELQAYQHAGQAADGEAPPEKTMTQAVTQIVIADVSMSLDNVLAVAGIAHEHTWVLIVGLALSVVFMGLAATLIARVLERHRWVAYLGLAVIFYVAVNMTVRGTVDLYFWSQLGV
jgi:YjbE family integral membrane protein